MSDYDNDRFEQEDFSNPALANEKSHKMKLSIDFLSVKDLRTPLNLQIQYQFKSTSQTHSFKSQKATAVGLNTEAKLQHSFSAYEFLASKSELLNLLSTTPLRAKILHKDSPSVAHSAEMEVGEVEVYLKELLQAPMRQTPTAVVRVSDQQLPIKDLSGQIKGVIRSVIYLEDLGEVVGTSHKAPNRSNSMQQENKNPNNNLEITGQSEVQAVYNVELWKRAEEAKFKAYLKQKEIERIEEITYAWKNKEVERERQFAESLTKVAGLEGKLRQKALDLQRREEKIVQLEEELKHKIQEVTRQLTLKEEEIMNVKKRFKEEKVLLEQDKKRLINQVEDFKNRLEQTEGKYYQFKREIDESPLTVLRQELGQKNLELIEKDSHLKQANEQKEEFQRRYEQVKRDMIMLKKSMDKEKESTLTKQAEELENLKTLMRNKQAQDEEKREIQTLRSQLMTLQSKITDTQKVPQQTNTYIPQTINDRAPQTNNPFYQMSNQQSNNIFLDNYARQQQSPFKEKSYQTMGHTGTVSGGVPPMMMGGQQTLQSEVERLMREKDDLLRSGCYTQDDPLIMELDRQIRVKQLGIQ